MSAGLFTYANVAEPCACVAPIEINTQQFDFHDPFQIHLNTALRPPKEPTPAPLHNAACCTFSEQIAIALHLRLQRTNGGAAADAGAAGAAGRGGVRAGFARADLSRHMVSDGRRRQRLWHGAVRAEALEGDDQRRAGRVVQQMR